MRNSVTTRCPVCQTSEVRGTFEDFSSTTVDVDTCDDCRRRTGMVSVTVKRSSVCFPTTEVTRVGFTTFSG